MEVIGGHCASTAVFVNAHHSIGIRALLLFGTPEQKARWLPPLAARREARGVRPDRDRGRLRRLATSRRRPRPSADGQTYILNGTKRYITNGGDRRRADRHGPHARPEGGRLEGHGVPGHARHAGLRGRRGADGQVRHPRHRDRPGSRSTTCRSRPTNILGPLGKGLKVALTVLDFGRTTFGASCTGLAKVCLAAAARHAARRRQFGRPLADLELVKKKLAFLAATAYAMEATTYETAALIDRGAEDYMLETAILKVFSTEALWQGVYETLQIHGGQGYFTDEPYERMMRDARINTIGEGANEVLKAFIALVGMRDIGEGFKATLEGLKRPSRFLPTLWRFGSERLVRLAKPPAIPVSTPTLRPDADVLGRRVARFGWAVERILIKHREAILERQYVQERIADAAIALVTASCTLARLDRELSQGAVGSDRPHRRRALPPDGQPPVRPGARRPRPQRRLAHHRRRRGRTPALPVSPGAGVTELRWSNTSENTGSSSGGMGSALYRSPDRDSRSISREACSSLIVFGSRPISLTARLHRGMLPGSWSGRRLALAVDDHVVG